MSTVVDQPAGTSPSRPSIGPVGVGAALAAAWVGYQERLDETMANAGFGDHPVPDGRVLRRCSGSDGATAADLGRELGMSRQGASKIVNALVERGFLAVSPSSDDGREKIVAVTPKAVDYLAAQRAARRAVDRDAAGALGDAGVEALARLVALFPNDGA